MVEQSQSRPGQFAAAIRKAQVASGVFPTGHEGDAGIDHGHKHEQPEVSNEVAPELLGKVPPVLRPAENADGE